MKKRSLPELEIKRSSIADAGLGLFALGFIRKGDLVTEYGGRVVDRKQAEDLRLRREDTHLRAVLLGTEALDSRIQEPVFSHSYYADNHLAGGFANESLDPKNNNTVYINERGVGRIHPSGEVASDRVFLKATRDIKAGEEILISYGSTYRKLHLLN